MKLIVYVLVGLFLSSCYSSRTTISGQDDISFLELIGDTKYYKGGVEIVIDENEPLIAQVNSKPGKRGNIVYKISPGVHTITIYHNSVLLSSSTIFTSSQETKRITLP